VWNSTKTTQNDWGASGHRGGGWHGAYVGDYLANITTIRWTINAVCPGDGCQQNYHSSTIITSSHTGGANFAMTDGSIHFLSDTIDLNNVLLRLASRNDSLVASVP
jgi:prepilin-type processing-associated H-X9-DG protein